MPLLDDSVGLTLVSPDIADSHSFSFSSPVEEFGDGTWFVAASPAMRLLRRQVQLIAQIDAPVFIVGESGSGKETVARLIHALSKRSQFTFLRISCAAIPRAALEKELFGSAREDSSSEGQPWPGKVERCQHGTVFLSDVLDMPARTQARLLYVLKHQQFFRDSRGTPIDSDVRFLAAASSGVEQALAHKTLRRDLYDSLSAFVLHVPPLRERREDIPLLIDHLMHRLSRTLGLTIRNLSPATLTACEAYTWPGNLRELENVVKQYMVVGDQESLRKGIEQKTAESRPPGLGPIADTLSRAKEPGLKLFMRTLRERTEKQIISGALDQTQWNRKAAARMLHISYRNLLYKIEEHRLTAPEGRRGK